MALQAQQPLLTALEQEVVHASVGSVASRATLDSDNRMFIDERAALLHVALDAGLPTGFGQLEVVHGAVRSVAIRTLHKTLGDPVMFRQRELRLDGAMAAKAKLGLRRLQDAVRSPESLFVQPWNREELGLRGLELGLPGMSQIHRMRRVAVNAGDAGGQVDRMSKRILPFSALVAAKALLRVLLGVAVEAVNQLRASSLFLFAPGSSFFGLGVRIPGAMAAFAPHAHLGVFRRYVRVRTFFELGRFSQMADFARGFTGVIARLALRGRLPGDGRTLGWGRLPLSVEISCWQESNHTDQQCSASNKTQQSLHFALPSSAFVIHRTPLHAQTRLTRTKKFSTSSSARPTEISNGQGPVRVGTSRNIGKPSFGFHGNRRL